MTEGCAKTTTPSTPNGVVNQTRLRDTHLRSRGDTEGPLEVAFWGSAAGAESKMGCGHDALSDSTNRHSTVDLCGTLVANSLR